MRTTIDLEADILQAAKEMTSVNGTTAGRVISDLARKALEPVDSPRIRNGVPLMPSRGPGALKVTMGHLATLDRGIPVGAIVGARPDLLQVLQPSPA